jgi:chromosome segregation protein
VATIEQQRTAAEQEREQRTQENAALAVKSAELAEIRAAALTQTQTVTAQAHELRTQLATLEATLKTGRSALDQIRDQRSEASNLAAKLKADLEHLEASCLAEVNVEAAAIRVDETIERIEGEALAAEEETCHGLKQRIEQMGPVNMMALDEYKESAERHSFLDVQRKDLQESIENTVDTIKEIDRISRTKFDEAFARINENFAQVFTRLFRGGQAFL